ncbi:methyltransferase family protein [Sediminihabitans luteus]|uniref:Methyltransferase family protein n=1 Tax=Sediminihabitans luteus TaxID=1138585 RepID=A0A2M9D153_9CELL|nr:class I SAM-dependent methyltransferase [Sediminihabitans luteus]PJJ77941.1 methyltransferase family protein [Sediminihabitans luteus]GII99701.1 SAM-dependent methyltransferase [Sediminihabitans luteus]
MTHSESHENPGSAHAHAHADSHNHSHNHSHSHSHSHSHDGADHHHAAHDDTAHDDADLAELLDLDAVVLADLLDQHTAWALDLRAGAATRRVLDLGAGTGTGTLALAHRFPRAEVTAVDASPQMLARTRARAFADGVADRVRTVAYDLDTVADDGRWPRDDAFTGPFDLVWASMSMHHLADPAAGFRRLHDVVAPDGLLVVVEMDARPTFLPDDPGVGRPGLEARLQALVTVAHGDMDAHPDWTPTLAATGWHETARRTATPDASSATQPALARYAHANLARTAAAVGDALDPDDRAALATLLGDGPLGVAQRDDLLVRGTRTAWAARRSG